MISTAEQAHNLYEAYRAYASRMILVGPIAMYRRIYCCNSIRCIYMICRARTYIYYQRDLPDRTLQWNIYHKIYNYADANDQST